MHTHSKVLRLILLGVVLALLGATIFPQDSSSDTEKNDESDISWKSYENLEHGYELKCPSRWKVFEAEPREGNDVIQEMYILLGDEIQKATFLEKDYELWPGECQVRVFLNPEKLSLEKWIENYEPRDVSGGSLVQDISESLLAGIPAKKLSIFGFDHEQIEIITIHGGKIYAMSFAGENPNDPNLKIHQEIFREMLASFTFVDQQRKLFENISSPYTNLNYSQAARQCRYIMNFSRKNKKRKAFIPTSMESDK